MDIAGRRYGPSLPMRCDDDDDDNDDKRRAFYTPGKCLRVSRCDCDDGNQTPAVVHSLCHGNPAGRCTCNCRYLY